VIAAHSMEALVTFGEWTMAILKLKRLPENPPEDAGGSWGDLVAWFSEMVIRLDKGDLAGAVEAQERIEKFGFEIKYRRRPHPQRGVAR
jgi:hypothetical protein